MDSQPDPGFGLFKVEFSRFRVLKRFGLGQLESFKQMLELLGAEVGVEHLETLGGTIPADVYVMPEPPEDDC